MVVRSLIAAVAGVFAGAACSIFLVFGPLELGGISNGPWRSNAHIGASDAGPVVRAIVARRGLLALNRSETVYFIAWTDDTGRRLREHCSYEISGGDMPARWWSLTLYAEDDFLAVNGDEAHALSRTDLGADGWSLIAGPARSDDEAWLSTRNSGAFSVTLRLYHPDARVPDAPETLALPSVRRLGCGGGD
ncbi:DUF1214 domain-containing protein [Maricaulis sp.]|uniref:DUF1214 domain-containing protein n=1 Tax=Maricaulis sp. TaxID=1486257 RepID=UPI00260FECE1|nr:DUF1214 domain-containing protein [Maricaulis sp.]